MFGWFRPKPPLPEEDRAWIDDRMQWLLREFGWERLRRVPRICPTAEFFPDPYDATQASIRSLLPLVCQYMAINPQRVELKFFNELRPPLEMLERFEPEPGALGYYWEEDEKCIIWLESSQLDDPITVIATLTHELGHVHLLGDRRLSQETTDHQPLTDLLAVCLGMGIFPANSAIAESYSSYAGWDVRRQGYLTGIMYGYALARYAMHRGETKPAWAMHLRLDVRVPFWKSFRYLLHHDLPLEPQRDRPAIPPGAFPANKAEAAEASSAAPDLKGHENGDVAATDGIDVNTVDGWLTAGVVEAVAGRHESAIASFDEAIALEPNDAEAYKLRGDAYAQLGEFAAALTDVTRAIELDPTDADAYRVRGIALAGIEQHELAIDDLLYYVCEEPEAASAYFSLGKSLAALGEDEQAQAAFSQAIHHRPASAEYYRARGEVRQRLGQHSKAVADYEEAERRDQHTQQ